MRIYVGATFGRYREVRGLIDRLTAAGHVVTHDWTRGDQFDQHGECVHQDVYDIPVDISKHHAELDLQGVRSAEVTIFLGQEPSCGWPIECGIAIGAQIETHVIDPFRHTCFFDLSWVHRHDDVEPLMLVLGAGLPRESVA